MPTSHDDPSARGPLTSTSPPASMPHPATPIARIASPASAIATALTTPFRSMTPSARCGVNAPPVRARHATASA